MKTGVTLRAIDNDQIEIGGRKVQDLADKLVLALMVDSGSANLAGNNREPIEVVFDGVDFAKVALIPQSRHPAAPLEDCGIGPNFTLQKTERI